jgi:site-specific recombinase XerD
MLSAEREPSDLVHQCTYVHSARVLDIPPERQDPIAAFVDVYMGLVRRFAPSTLNAYRLDLRRLRAFRDPRSLLTVSREDLARFLASLHASGLSRNTLRRQIAVLRSFYAWTEREGLTRTNPAALIEGPREQRRLPRIPSIVDRGDRLPQKSTFFWPKPRTGLVIRPLDP